MVATFACEVSFRRSIGCGGYRIRLGLGVDGIVNQANLRFVGEGREEKEKGGSPKAVMHQSEHEEVDQDHPSPSPEPDQTGTRPRSTDADRAREGERE